MVSRWKQASRYLIPDGGVQDPLQELAKLQSGAELTKHCAYSEVSGPFHHPRL